MEHVEHPRRVCAAAIVAAAACLLLAIPQSALAKDIGGDEKKGLNRGVVQRA